MVGGSGAMIALLAAVEIDGALVARDSDRERWKGERSRDHAPGVIYARYFYIRRWPRAVDSGGRPAPNPRSRLRYACEIEGIGDSGKAVDWGSSHVEAITLTVALLCTRSFNYNKLMLEGPGHSAVDIDNVRR